MKDSIHHRKYTQKKVIQSLRRESNDFKSFKTEVSHNDFKANTALRSKA